LAGSPPPDLDCRSAKHLAELYGVEIGRDTICNVTDAVLEDVALWRSRPLDAVYPIVYFDAMFVKVREDRSVRNRACYLALGVTCDGEREVLACGGRRPKAQGSGWPFSTTASAAASTMS
jgi:transposase-like protein